ncbi:hypothetical protein JCGZ_10644 [Jatropha curcas]|uniref:Uncharacterized protein n=1 Tax=Jatropha curcas TaxID=180498 RepID=A0A067KHY7_JATCU|nr:hypothetical protein JCGZ_10644 [Jatropha curcas]
MLEKCSIKQQESEKNGDTSLTYLPSWQGEQDQVPPPPLVSTSSRRVTAPSVLDLLAKNMQQPPTGWCEGMPSLVGHLRGTLSEALTQESFLRS